MKKQVGVFLFCVALCSLLVVNPASATYGGGGGSYTATPPALSAPINGQTGLLFVNRGSATTTETRVTLTMPQTNADQMAVSNYSDFRNVSWESYSATKEWVLLPEYGTKTIYAMFRNSSTGAFTQTISASVELVKLADVTVPAVTPTVTTPVVTTPATTVAAPAYKFTSYLYLGSKGAEVMQLQQKLKDLGYFKGTVNSTFDQTTKAAVIAFQKAKNLSPFPGWVGPGTRAALNAVASTSAAPAATTPAVSTTKYTFKSYMYLGSQGAEVKALQTKLKELGYFKAEATGYFGTVTKAAVAAFQKANNLTPYPGWVGPGTRTLLNK